MHILLPSLFNVNMHKSNFAKSTAYQTGYNLCTKYHVTIKMIQSQMRNSLRQKVSSSMFVHPSFFEYQAVKHSNASLGRSHDCG